MYGIMPMAKMLNRSKEPPENILSMPKMPPPALSYNLANAAASTPGTGMCAPMRNTSNAPSKNNKRFFKSPNFASPVADC